MTHTHSTKTPATPADFAKWEARAREMSAEALAYSIRDCAESARAMRGHDAIAEGVYLDEMSAYVTERNRRREAK